MGRAGKFWKGRRGRWLVATLIAVAGHLGLIVAMTPTSRPTHRAEPTVYLDFYPDPERRRPLPGLRKASRQSEPAAEAVNPREVPQAEALTPSAIPVPAFAQPAPVVGVRRVEAPPALYPPSAGRGGCIDPRTGKPRTSCDLGPAGFGPSRPLLALSPRAGEFEAGKAQRNGGPIELGGGLSLRHRNGRQVPLHENRCEGGNLGMNCLEESAVGIVSQKF